MTTYSNRRVRAKPQHHAVVQLTAVHDMEDA